MKKILLVLSLAFFVATTFATVTKIQQYNAADTEFVLMSDDASTFVNLNDDEPKKEPVAKKDAKKSSCASSASCDKTKCASKTDASAKTGCCSSKTSTDASAGKAACCSKEKAVVNDSDKK